MATACAIASCIVASIDSGVPLWAPQDMLHELTSGISCDSMSIAFSRKVSPTSQFRSSWSIVFAVRWEVRRPRIVQSHVIGYRAAMKNPTADATDSGALPRACSTQVA